MRLFPTAAAITLAALPLTARAATPADHGEAIVRYDGYKAIQVIIEDAAQLDEVEALGAELLSCSHGLGPVEYIASPETLAAIRAAGLDVAVLDEDIQIAIDAERARLDAGAAQAQGDWFADFKALGNINSRLSELRDQRPDLASLHTVGTTPELRTITAIRISGPGATSKPAVLFNGTQHAREWVSPMVNVFIADALINGYDSDPEIRALVDAVEIWVIPVVNPDGYTWSWGPNRMWRKNRRTIEGTTCRGVDTNRNWAVAWGGPGSADAPCSNTYRGTEPFSEAETIAMRDFYLDHPNIVANIDFHAFSQLILWPYGYTEDLPPDQATFESLGNDMADAIFDVHGQTYFPGPIASTLYIASGNSVDWAYDDQGVISYTIELRPTTGNPGFLLPPEEIRPTCEENFPAALAMLQWASDTHGISCSIADISVNNAIDFDDLSMLLADWGPCTSCLGDIDGSNSIVDFDDLATLLAFWGPCP